jgi:hypothetical protein
MYCTIDTQVAQKRCDDLKRQADHYRLVKEAAQGNKVHVTRFVKVRKWIGEQLVIWGYRLQGRVTSRNIQGTGQVKVVDSFLIH